MGATVSITENSQGRITAEGVQDLRGRIGRPIREQDFGPPIPVAAIDSIRLWSWGIGDDNPLYNSLDYAAAGPWAGLTAPPSIVLGMDPHRLGIMSGLPGVHALYAGVNFEWYRPVRIGTAVATRAAIVAVDEKESQASGKSVKVISHSHIADAEGGDLARMEHVVTRHERAASRERGSFAADAGTIPHKYKPEEIAAIAEEYRQEPINRRGGVDRRWGDVAVGDVITPIIKGPLTVTGIVAFAMAVRPVHLTLAHRMAFQLFDKHPGTAIPNEFGTPEPPISVHWSEQQARHSGLPTAYDFGMERACWAAHLFTDWMGDSGFLKSLTVRFRGPNYLGDLTRFSGEVVEKSESDGLATVRCSYVGTNQRGQTTTSGEAVIALPSEIGKPADVLGSR